MSTYQDNGNRSANRLHVDQSYPNITGGGFVSTGPNVIFQRQNANQVESAHVYDTNFKGQTYSVKYLGIVDGSMGILSRKMALKQPNPAHTMLNSSPLSIKFESKERVPTPLEIKTNQLSQRSTSFCPVLGSKYNQPRVDE